MSDVCTLAFVERLLPDQGYIPRRRLLVRFLRPRPLPIALFGLHLPPNARTFPLSDSITFDALNVGYFGILLSITVCKSTQIIINIDRDLCWSLKPFLHHLHSEHLHVSVYLLTHKKALS